MKSKCLIFFLLLFFPIVTAFSSNDLTTEQLIQRQNQFYEQKNIEVKIKVVNTRPAKVAPKEIYLLVKCSNKRNNIQLYVGKSWQKIITSNKKSALLTSQSELLKSTNKNQFSQGVKRLLRAVFTLIDQSQGITSKYDLAQFELDKMLKPRSLSLPVAIMFGLIFMSGTYLYRKFIFKR